MLTNRVKQFLAGRNKKNKVFQTKREDNKGLYKEGKGQLGQDEAYLKKEAGDASCKSPASGGGAKWYKQSSAIATGSCSFLSLSSNSKLRRCNVIILGALRGYQ